MSSGYRLDHAPLFALGDGGDVATIRSDSLVRVQVYSAVASGARGLYYYCWGHGIWNSTAASENFNPSSIHSNYEVVRRTNADAQVWGTLLLGSRHVGHDLCGCTDLSNPQYPQGSSGGAGKWARDPRPVGATHGAHLRRRVAREGAIRRARAA